MTRRLRTVVSNNFLCSPYADTIDLVWTYANSRQGAQRTIDQHNSKGNREKLSGALEMRSNRFQEATDQSWNADPVIDS